LPVCLSRKLSRLRRCLAPLAAASLALVLAALACGEESELRVRLAWLGETPRSWQGTIHVTEGAIVEFMALGLEPDTPGEMHLLDPATLAVAPRFPRAYDGVDLKIKAPRGAALIIELAPDGGGPAQTVEWPLETLAKLFQQANLDDQGSRLVGQRSPGDRLPVTIPRDHLVFAPGEKFEFTVMPRTLDLAPSAGYLLNVALHTARGGE
jgi:hypothetical protein